LKLSQFLNKLITLELKNSECYLWCSINFEALEIRQFFADMSDEELKHARLLTEISQSPEASLLSLEVPPDLPDKMVLAAVKISETIKKEKDLDQCFRLIAQLECGELNVIYDSILKHFDGNKKANFLAMNTSAHINMLKEAAEKYVNSPEVKKQVLAIEVRNRDYYKLFLD